MMVTFVSECEKKALMRTRRVLDAFANRIGSRTWQTVITEEGLQAVKKLLRKTASKNTAVACHWIRSRSRSDLLWVVGNQDKFNLQGYVPVNYTDGELIMDQVSVNIENYYANTKKQKLVEHLFAVGYLASQVIERLNLVSLDKAFSQVAFVAGCLHDMGKLDPLFQTWILDKTKKALIEEMPEDGQHIDSKQGWFDIHPRHNEISVLFYHLLNDDAYQGISIPNKNSIKHALYWHHAKPLRKLDAEFKDFDAIYKKLKKNLGDADFGMMFSAFRKTVQQINELLEEYLPDSELELEGFLTKADENRIDGLTGLNLPDYKRYTIDDYAKNIETNSLNNLLRTAVVTADRLISQLSSDELSQHITEKTLHTVLDKALVKERGLNLVIQECLAGFESRYPNSDRNKQQSIAASDLADEEVHVGVLRGAAGCGKTKIALEWAFKTGVKKIIWICPRVQVCQGLFKDLTSKEYLPNSKIEINTGEFKQILKEGKVIDTPENEFFSGDIVITTIDQVLNNIITHRQVDGLITYMDSHVVFDEFHEYINMPAFNLLFAELVECKKLQKEHARALLVSATPNYYFVKEFLKLNPNDIIGIDSFNESQYQIKFIKFDEATQDNNPLYEPQPKNTFVISNTAMTAQLSFIKNQAQENALLFHGKFKKSDKQALFDKVFDSFNEYGNHHYDLLRSGPIIQAALNISSDKMVTEFTHAENWLQRLGRLDRFGKNDFVNEYITAIPESLAIGGKQISRCAKFLDSLSSLQSAKAWHEFLQDNDIEEKNIGINELYQLYQEFYENDKCRKAIAEDFEKAIKKSVMVINNKLIDPVSIPSKKSAKESKVKIKKLSLRGDNRFVQMAVRNIGNGKEEFPNEYAYLENDLEEANKAGLTYPVDAICGYGDIEQDLLEFMSKKHHNIKDAESYGVKDTTKFKNKIYLNKSRELETPIYLSYTATDLEEVGKVSPHPYAIYYVIGINQPIGAVALNRLELEE